MKLTLKMKLTTAFKPLYRAEILRSLTLLRLLKQASKGYLPFISRLKAGVSWRSRMIPVVFFGFIGLNLQADIKVTQLENSFTVLEPDRDMFSPLYGLALRSTHYFENLYRYGDDSHSTVQLIRELFYYHPILHTFTITASKEKIASYLKPSTIGIIIRKLDEFASTAAAIAEELEVDSPILTPEEQISSLALAIMNDIGPKPLLEILLNQKIFDAQRKKIQQEVRTEAIKKAKDTIEQNFESFIKPKIATLQKKIPLLAGKSEEEVIKIIIDNQRSKQDSKFATTVEAMIVNEAEARAVGSIKDVIQQRYLAFSLTMFRQLSTLLIKSQEEWATTNKNFYYPSFMTYLILQAFLCEKANDRADIKAYFDQLPEDFFNQTRESLPFTADPIPVDKGRYLAIVNTIKRIPEEKFKAFLNALKENDKLYEQVILTGLGASLYEDRFAQPISYISSSYKGKSFFDCGESALRTFFNLLVKVPNDPVFNVDFIAPILPENSPLSVYYKKYSSIDKINTIEAHNDFNEIVSNLFGVAYARYIKNGATFKKDHVYRSKNYEFTYELEGGIGNFLILVRTLLNLPEFEKYIQEQNIIIAHNSLKRGNEPLTNEQISRLLQELFKNLSRKNFIIELTSVKEETFNFKIIDGAEGAIKKYEFTYQMDLHGHAEIQENKGEGRAWRELFLSNVYMYATPSQIEDDRYRTLLEAYYSGLDAFFMPSLNMPDKALQWFVGINELDEIPKKALEIILTPRHPFVVAMLEKNILMNLASEDDEERWGALSHLEVFLKAEREKKISGFGPKLLVVLGNVLKNENPEIKKDAEKALSQILTDGSEKNVSLVTAMVDRLLASEEPANKAEATLILVHMMDSGHGSSIEQMMAIAKEESILPDMVISQLKLLRSLIDAGYTEIEPLAIARAMKALKAPDVATQKAAILLTGSLMKYASVNYPKELSALQEHMLQHAMQSYQNTDHAIAKIAFSIFDICVRYKYQESYPFIIDAMKNLLPQLMKRENEGENDEIGKSVITLCRELILNDYKEGLADIGRILTVIWFNINIDVIAIITDLFAHTNAQTRQRVGEYILQAYLLDKERKPIRNFYKDCSLLEVLIREGYEPAYKLGLELISNNIVREWMITSMDLVLTQRLVKTMVDRGYRLVWKSLPKIINNMQNSKARKNEREMQKDYLGYNSGLGAIQILQNWLTLYVDQMKQQVQSGELAL